VKVLKPIPGRGAEEHVVYKVKLRITEPNTGEVIEKYSTMFPDHWSE